MVPTFYQVEGAGAQSLLTLSPDYVKKANVVINHKTKNKKKNKNTRNGYGGSIVGRYHST